MLHKGCLGILHKSGGLIFHIKYFILFLKDFYEYFEIGW